MPLPSRTTAGGGTTGQRAERPVHKFLMECSSEERAEIAAAMKEVRNDGLAAARHLKGDIYEVKADTSEKFFRVLFAADGKHKQVLLSFVAFAKKSNKTPPAELELANKRLKDWRKRGA